MGEYLTWVLLLTLAMCVLIMLILHDVVLPVTVWQLADRQ